MRGEPLGDFALQVLAHGGIKAMLRAGLQGPDCRRNPD